MKYFTSLAKVLALLCVCLSAYGGVQAADDQPGMVLAALPAASQAVNLQLYQHQGCRLDQTQSQTLRQGIGQIENVYQQAFKHQSPSGHPLVVHLFCSEAEYRAYGASTGSDASSDTGYYSLQRNEMVVYSKYGLAQSLQTIYHEASHALLRSQPGPYPKWLNEGLAEYFEGGVPQQDGQLLIMPQRLKESRIQRLFKAGQLPGLQAYLSQSDKVWQAANSPEPLSSTIGWSLVYFLMESESGRQTLQSLVKLHRSEMLPLQAVNQVYPGGVRAFEQDWHQWLQSSRQQHIL